MDKEGEHTMDKKNQILLKIFYVLIFVTMVTFFAALKFLPVEDITSYDDFEVLNANWYYINPDHTKTPVELPTRIESEFGKNIVFECELPKVEDNKTLVFRASKQNMHIYITDEQRGTYEIGSNNFFNDNNESAYVYVPIKTEDSHQILRVDTQSDSRYSGIMKNVYYGSELDVFINLAKKDIVTFMSAIVVFFISIIVIGVCIFIRIKFKIQTSFIYLAHGTAIICTWLIAQSSLRQVFFQNITIVSDLKFWAIMLGSIPFLIYMNEIQKNRYVLFYNICIVLNIAMFMVANCLWIFTPIDFSDLIYVMWGVIGISACTIVIAALIDFYKKLIKDYTIVLGGFLCLLISIAYQMFIYGNKTVIYSGFVLALGMVLLLITAGIKASTDYSQFVFEKNILKQTVVEKERKIEKMSVQFLYSLTKAIDARDAYTNGHSLRVAQYSQLLAKKMDLSSEIQSTIYYTALLHDIGKIGIPDHILNKDSRLTNEEYEIIKTHTVVGYEILQHLEEIPEIEFGAKWHHERYDGKGYPDKLKGNEIPLNARIIAVADAYDAMTSSRVYRKELSKDYVSAEIENGIGTQFDPEIARKLLELFDSVELFEIKNELLI